MATFNTAGTITVTNGSAAVTGSGSNWAAAGISGGTLYIDGAAYPIVSIDGNTSLTLAIDYAGASGGGKTYAIAVEQSVLDQTIANANRLAQILEDLNPLGSYTTFSNGLMEKSSQGEWRSGLGLAIGTNVQAYNENLTTLAGLGGSARAALELVTPTFETAMTVSGTYAYTHIIDTNGVLEGSMSAGVRIYAGEDEHAQFGMPGTSSGILYARNLQGNMYIEADTRNLHDDTQLLLRVDGMTILTLSASGLAAFNMFSGEVIVSDNAAATISLGTNSGCVFISNGAAETYPLATGMGHAYFDVGLSVSIAIGTARPEFEIYSGNVTGSTGRDGAITLGGVPGALKIENRTGAARSIRYAIIG